MTYIEQDERGGIPAHLGRSDYERAIDEISKLFEGVDLFASAMKAKLATKAAQGFTGWDDPNMAAQLKRMLIEHVDRMNVAAAPQEIDIANLAMMLWYQRNEPKLRAMHENDVARERR
jgi:hypothetical protein